MQTTTVRTEMCMNENLEQNLPINIIVAHGLEAKALLSAFNLERGSASTEFPQYRNAQGLTLLVSGIGKSAVAAAVRYLGQMQANEDGQIRAWLNIGIAGHRDAAIGTAWLGNKIFDQRAGVSAFPGQLIPGIPVGSVVTVEVPENVYPIDAAYEMEASAFYTEANKYSTAELVQVFKIISDNLGNPLSEIDLRSVPRLIAAQQSQIQKIVEAMSGIVEQFNAAQRLPDYYHVLCSKVRLTVNQKLQLRRLCQRYKALGLEADLGTVAKNLPDAGKLLRQLDEFLDRRSAL